MTVIGDLRALIDGGETFGTIYADPPWPYSNQATRSATGKVYTKKSSLDDILKLPVPELSAKDAHLHLWTTNAFLFAAKEVMDAWGFEYKSVFVWVKPNIGIGNYWRVSHEFMLLGIRGNAKFANRSIRSWLECNRGEHSRKPDRIRELIESVSPGPRLELYGRELKKGWTVWGDDVRRNLFAL